MSAPEVARQCGIHEATVRRWLRRADFKAKVDAARGELVSQTVGRLSDSTTAAVLVLKRLLSEDTPPSVRLGAARAILEMAARYRESEELAKRVAALEEIVQSEGRR